MIIDPKLKLSGSPVRPTFRAVRATSIPLNELRLARDGAQLFPNVLGAGERAELCSLVDAQSVRRAGVRLFDSPGLGRFVDAGGALGAVAARMRNATRRRSS
jgi:hypothetical protein